MAASEFFQVRAFSTSFPSVTIQFLRLRYEEVNAPLPVSAYAKIKKSRMQLKKARKSGKSATVKKVGKWIKKQMQKLTALS